MIKQVKTLVQVVNDEIGISPDDADFELMQYLNKGFTPSSTIIIDAKTIYKDDEGFLSQFTRVITLVLEDTPSFTEVNENLLKESRHLAAMANEQVSRSKAINKDPSASISGDGYAAWKDYYRGVDGLIGQSRKVTDLVFLGAYTPAPTPALPADVVEAYRKFYRITIRRGVARTKEAFDALYPELDEARVDVVRRLGDHISDPLGDEDTSALKNE
jgi:hypothetical protein